MITLSSDDPSSAPRSFLSRRKGRYLLVLSAAVLLSMAPRTGDAASDRPRSAFSHLTVAASAGGLKEQQFLPGEILVKFKPDVTSRQIESLNRRHGSSVVGRIEGIDVYRLSVPEGRSVQEMIDVYQRDPHVEYAEPNYTGRGGDVVPDDPFFEDQWHLNNVGQAGGTVDADIDAVEGWQLSRGSSDVVVAVLDTGIDRVHPEFQGRLLQGFDFVNEDADPDADHPHGISVTGILAANSDNASAIAGVDHNATILPVKVLNRNSAGTTADLVQGLVFAANQGADIISMSLIDYPLTAALNDALQFARDAGSVLIACAGSAGIGDADVSGPGASPLTISVGASNRNDERPVFSGTGAALDLVAPGVALPTIFNSSAEVTRFSGCSAATPVAAGIASLLLSIDPSLAHEDVRDILIQTAEDEVGPAAEDTPGRDDFFGFGRVNLNDALLSLTRPVAVDIRPRRCPNLVRTRVFPVPFLNTLPVTILGTKRLDVFEVDVEAVRLAGVAASRPPIFKDLATPFEPFIGKSDASDCTRAKGDGFKDLHLRFETQAIVDALEPVEHKDVVVAPLTGKLLDGTFIRGEDVVVIIDVPHKDLVRQRQAGPPDRSAIRAEHDDSRRGKRSVGGSKFEH